MKVGTGDVGLCLGSTGLGLYVDWCVGLSWSMLSTFSTVPASAVGEAWSCAGDVAGGGAKSKLAADRPKVDVLDVKTRSSAVELVGLASKEGRSGKAKGELAEAEGGRAGGEWSDMATLTSMLRSKG